MEKIVDLFIILSIGLLATNLILSPAITGAVIGLSRLSSLLIPILLIILIFIKAILKIIR